MRGKIVIISTALYQAVAMLKEPPAVLADSQLQADHLAVAILCLPAGTVGVVSGMAPFWWVEVGAENKKSPTMDS